MSASQRLSRGFHRLGLLLAAILFAVGLVVMVVDAVHLGLWETKVGDLPTVVFGFVVGLVGLSLAGLALYGLVRAIGWVIGGFTSS